MIVDTSAVLAILKDEPDADVFMQALYDADIRRLSAASFVEASVVFESVRDPLPRRLFDEFITGYEIIIEPVTASQARIARDAYRDFGKGRGTKAKLNFGDCFAYALARETREPLLYKGNDFVHTDVVSALKKH